MLPHEMLEVQDLEMLEDSLGDASLHQELPFDNKTLYDGRKGDFWTMDSTINSYWNNDLGIMKPSSKWHYEYDGNGNWKSRVYLWYNEDYNSWNYGSKYEYVQSEAGFLEMYYYSYWNEQLNQWIYSTKYEYSNDESGNAIEIIRYSWDSEINSWVNSSFYKYTYTTSGKRATYQYQKWNSDLNDWEPSTYIEYTYDKNDNMTKYLWYSWDSNLEDWKENILSSSTYNENGFPTETIDSIMDNTLNKMIPNHKVTYDYTAQGKDSLALSYNWDTTLEAWQLYQRRERSYPSGDLEVHTVFSNWNSNTESMENAIRYKEYYDANANRIEFRRENWNTETEKWDRQSKNDYYWSEKNISENPPDAKFVDTETEPVIDGLFDEAYHEADFITLDHLIFGSLSSTKDLAAAYKALWDTNNLYIIVKVMDDIPGVEYGYVYDRDQVVINLDIGNEKLTSYDENDFQIEFTRNETNLSGMVGNLAGNGAADIKFKFNENPEGYNLEIKLPWSVLSVDGTLEGKKFGFDIRVRDNDGATQKESVVSWKAYEEATVTKPDVFGETELIDIVNTGLPENKVADVDGNIYSTVQIGAQTWMTENMRTKYYSAGNAIPATYYYDDDLSNLETYGRLYPWNEAMNYSTTPGAQGICPDGYHIPSDEDWKALERFLGMQENKLDLTGPRGYFVYTLIYNGFNPVTGGLWWQSSWNIGLGHYWSSTETDAEKAVSRDLVYSQIERSTGWNKLYGMSVRCMKNQELITVTFKADMSHAIAAGTFTEGTDKVYITGSMVDWTEPGDGSIELTESDTDNIYTTELSFLPGLHRYNYYLNTGWNHPEWEQDLMREVLITDSIKILEDVFGPEPAKPINGLELSSLQLPSTIKANDIAASLDVDQEQSLPPISIQYSFSLVSGEGSSDNNLFYTTGDSLMINTNLADVSKETFSVRIRVEDQFGNNYDKSFDLNSAISIWEKQSTGVSSSIREIFATSEENVWSTTMDGTILRTIDGGENWKIITTFTDTDEGGFCAINESTAWMVVSYNYSDNPNTIGLYKTTDGGTNWIRQSGLYDGEGAFPNWVYFWNENDGLVAGDNLELYTTTDGGNNWNAVTDMPGLTHYQINTLNYTSVIGDTLWYSTANAIYRSIDKGHTWEAYNFNPHDYLRMGYLAFKNNQEGLILNGNYLAKTTNGGETWTMISPNGEMKKSGLEYDPDLDRYVSYGNIINTGEGYGVSYSYDDGQTWVSDNRFIYQASIGAGDVSQPNIAWVGSTGGNIFKNLKGSVNNLAPVLNGSIPDTVARVDEPFEYTIPGGLFSDPDEEDALSFTAKQTDGEALPDWLTMTGETLSGTPVEMDLLNLRITARDNYDLSVSDDFKLVVEEYETLSTDEIEIDTTTSEGEVIVVIPASVFTDMGLTGEIVYEAFMADGSPLPDYIEFDADSLLFRFTLSEKKSLMDILEELNLIIKGTDSSGYVGIIGFTIEGDFVGLSNEITSMLKIYPQPAIDILNIEFDKDFQNTRKIIVYSVKGQMLRSIESSEQRIELDLGSLPSSVYYLRIIDDTDRTYQIMKQ